MNNLHPEEYVEKIAQAINLVIPALTAQGFEFKAVMREDVEDASQALDLMIQGWILNHMTPGMEI